MAVTITVLLILVLVALLATALTPPDVKARSPKVWVLLESLAINVGSAQNSAGPAGSPRLALVAYVVAACALLYPQGATVPAVTGASLDPAVTFVATLPAAPTATALSVAVSPTTMPKDVTP